MNKCIKRQSRPYRRTKAKEVVLSILSDFVRFMEIYKLNESLALSQETGLTEDFP